MRALADSEKLHEDVYLSVVLHNLGLLYLAQSRIAETEEIFKRAVVWHKKTSGPSQEYTIRFITQLGGVYE